MTTTEEVLSRLNPKVRKSVLLGNTVEIEKQKLPLESLNVALNGGLAYGRQALIYGSKSAGKSSLCLQIVAEAQKIGKVCAWVDAEKSYDPEWAERLGVNNEELIYVPVNKVNDIVDMSTSLMDAEVDLLVVDSISAGLGGIFFEKDGSLKKLEDTGQIGADAKAWGSAVKMINYMNKNTLVILISQLRAGINNTYVEHIPTGGKAVLFYSSTVLRLSSSKSKTIDKKVDVGGRMTQKTVGREVTWNVEFNKLAEPNKTGTYNFLFDGEFVGVDRIADLVGLCIERGVIQQSGAWFSHDDFKVQGREDLNDLVRSDLELQKRLQEELHG